MTSIVEQAEDFVKNKLMIFNPKINKKEIKLTTSQIRKFLSAVNRLENQVSAEEETLSENITNEITYLKIKLAYQAGRERNVKVLYEELSPMINKIGNSKAEFLKFARYIEAIVAYHKFYGGGN